MKKEDRTARQSVVQVVGPADGWILERLARRLVAKLPYAEFIHPGTQPSAGVALIYYVNYFLYSGPSGCMDVGFFTHLDESNQFLERARSLDFCVCISRKYEAWLRQHCVEKVTCIPMPFDSYRYRPRLVLGVIGLLDHPRKGRHLVEEVRKLPFVQVIATEGKLPEDQLLDLYERLDYVLIPSTVEGGPMSLLEGLGMGKPIIAPDEVGMVPEFEVTEHVRRYPTGDVNALLDLVRQCFEQKLDRRRLVQDRTWDRWAEGHHALFAKLLEARGMALPRPCPEFRFGMLGELDVPWGIDVRPLEAAIDQAARHLYFGEFKKARLQIRAVLDQYPFAEKLLNSIPQGKTTARKKPKSAEYVGKPKKGSDPQESKTWLSSVHLGCVLAIQNRPAEYLERTLETYAFQTRQPVDKVLVDYGSEPGFAAAYRELCRRYGWRYVLQAPTRSGWTLSEAYNAAVDALDERVQVVFKSDIDVLLGEDVLAKASEIGREKLCIFTCKTTVEGTTYPESLAGHGALLRLLESPNPPVEMLGEGIHAYPRKWFTEIGGFDLDFTGWGFEDSDLRFRALKSIGVHNDTSSLLIHQWHPRTIDDRQANNNRTHYNRMKKDGPLVRNGGKPIRGPCSSESDLRIAYATRSMNDFLSRVCGELLGRDVKHHRLLGTDSTSYFRELLALDGDWVASVDEDVFVLDPGRLVGLIRHLNEQGYAACGVPDGGVVSIRKHNPLVCNAFFNIFDLRRVRPIWHEWQRALSTRHNSKNEKLVPGFAKRTPFAFDHFEPYYGLFFALLDAGERILYIDATDWQDGMTTLVKDAGGHPLLLHGWYSRSWETNPETRNRFRIAIDYARWRQGFPLLQWDDNVRKAYPMTPPVQVAATSSDSMNPATSGSSSVSSNSLASPIGNWEALFRANRDPFPFGDTLTYEKAAQYLDGLETVEDWGCGQGWFRRYLNPSVNYKGIDGSRSPGLDVVADLATYTSKTEGLLLRHVLEHNEGWSAILHNALESFTKRMVVVLFTPFAQVTHQIAFNPTIGVPDIAFAKDDLTAQFKGFQWRLEENLRTKTQYGVEHVFYLER